MFAEGGIRTLNWEVKDWNGCWPTEMLANEMQMLGSLGGGGTQGAQRDDSGSVPAPGCAGSSGFSESEFDDDIPFEGFNGLEIESDFAYLWAVSA